MNITKLRLVATFNLNMNSEKQVAIISVYEGKKKLSTVKKEIKLVSSPKDVKNYISKYGMSEYEEKEIWCKYMRGEDYEPGPFSDWSETDYLEDYIAFLERKLSEAININGTADSPEPPYDDGLPF